MEKFKQKLSSNVKDRTAAFAIVIAIIITWIVVFGIIQFVGYNNYVKANATLSVANNNGNEDEKTQEMIEQAKKESKIDEEKAKKENEEEFEKLKEKKKIDTSAINKYYIKVNYGAQVVTVYTQDSNGDYTVPVRAMVCSTGTYTPTSGVYRTLGKGNWWPLMGDVYGQYSTWICGDILFHSVPYLTKGDKSSLEYWAYDQLGQRVSMGCVRLTTADALWIYNNCPVGTQVEFYASSNPGPLGKPSTRKISNAPSGVRGWDPTDPDSDNPWPEYLEEQENKKNEDKKPNKDENKKPDKDENKKPDKEEPDKDEDKEEEVPDTKPDEGEDSGEGSSEGSGDTENPSEGEGEGGDEQDPDEGGNGNAIEEGSGENTLETNTIV